MISVFGFTPLLISILKPFIFSSDRNQCTRFMRMEDPTVEWQYVFSQFLSERHVHGRGDEVRHA